VAVKPSDQSWVLDGSTVAPQVSPAAAEIEIDPRGSLRRCILPLPAWSCLKASCCSSRCCYCCLYHLSMAASGHLLRVQCFLENACIAVVYVTIQ